MGFSTSNVGLCSEKNDRKQGRTACYSHPKPNCGETATENSIAKSEFLRKTTASLLETRTGCRFRRQVPQSRAATRRIGLTLDCFPNRFLRGLVGSRFRFLFAGDGWFLRRDAGGAALVRFGCFLRWRRRLLTVRRSKPFQGLGDDKCHLGHRGRFAGPNLELARTLLHEHLQA